jgi:carbonic anhydrase/acetyltransferase-like protein (isoleucine patch superfamily)
MSATILTFQGKTPEVAEGAFIAPNATLIGDVRIGAGSSVWFGCVLRGDVGFIRVGERSNVQDLACIHMTDGLSNTTIGDDVTIGHGAILHGCTVEDGALIGMGAILLDGVVVGKDSVVAAGALVPPRTVIPPGSMVKGSPAKVVRAATEEERAMGRQGAAHYVAGARAYLPLVRMEK